MFSQINAWKDRYVLGITGIIGSGKSSVSRAFEKLGAVRLDSDVLAKHYTSSESPIIPQLVSILGASILDSGGVPDRKKIASIVFYEPSKLEELVQIIHPLVRKDALNRISNIKDGSIIAWEVPLLFESKANLECNSTLTVSAPIQTCLQRTISRDAISEEEFYKRLSKQMSLKEKLAISDFIIENDKTPEELNNACKKIYNHIIQSRLG